MCYRLIYLHRSGGWSPNENGNPQWQSSFMLEGFDGVRLIDRRGSDMELRVHNTLNTVTAQWRKV